MKIKKLFTVIALTALTSLPACAIDGITGDGTSDSPYLIGTASDWNTLVAYMSSNGATLKGEYVQITNDIAFSQDEDTITTIGVFAGDLDGNGKTLSGINRKMIVKYTAAVIDTVEASGYVHDLTVSGTITVKASYCAAVVGALYGKMSNVTCNATVTSTSQYTGGMIGYTNAATIEDCVFGGKLTGSAIWIGGVAGFSYYGCEYIRCGNTGTVTSTTTSSTSSYAYSGGLIGSSYYGTFTDCYNTGTVSGSTSNGQCVAGLIPHLYNSGTFTFKRCYNTGTVTGYAEVAGLTCRVGTTTIQIDMDSCYNTGTISSKATSNLALATVGLAAETALASNYTNCWNSGTITSVYTRYTAGLFGTYNSMASTSGSDITFSNCYNTGNVTGGNSYTGGIIARSSTKFIVDNCYNTGTISGTNYVGGIVGCGYGSSGAKVISNCYNTGDVTGSAYYVGGIVGCSLTDTIKNCFNVGDVATTNISSSTTGYAIGGIAGYSNGTVYDVYNTGDVAGADRVAGLVGEATSGNTVISRGYSIGAVSCTSTDCGNIIGTTASSLSNTYYLSDQTGGDTDTSSTAVSRAELAAMEMEGWENGDNYTYPRLSTLADNDYALAHAAAVIPADGNSYSYISQAFNVGTPDGVEWTASSDVVTIEGNTATFSDNITGSLTMTATSGDVSVKTVLYCVVDDADDVEGNKVVETFEDIETFSGDATDVQGVFTTWDFAGAYVATCDDTSGNDSHAAVITNGGTITSTLAITADTIRSITLKAWNATSNDATLHLYYSTDRGNTWTEAYEEDAEAATTVAAGATKAKSAYMLEMEQPVLFIKVAADVTGSGYITIDDLTLIYKGELSNVATFNVDGDGTATSPYLISTPDEWNAFATYVAESANTMNGEYVKLAADIDFSETTINQVGYNYITLFDGDFDGDGKTMKGIAATSDHDYFGALFTTTGTNALIHDFTIEGAVTSSYDYTGGTVGCLYGTVSNVVNNLTVTSSGSYTGGIAGYAAADATIANSINNATIKSSGQCVAGIAGGGGLNATYDSCVNNATISFTATSGTAYAGGIVGYSSRCSFIDCGNTADITTSGTATTIGGIAAYIYYTSDGSTVFTRCYNTGNLQSYSSASGIAAVTGTDSKVTMTDCYNTGDITTTSTSTSGYTAGLLGLFQRSSTYTNNRNSGTITSNGAYYTAGLFGSCGTSGIYEAAVMDSCRNTGDVVSAGAYVGGLMAYAINTTVSNSYNTGNVSGTYYVGGIAGYSSDASSVTSTTYNVGTVSATGDYVGGIAGLGEGSYADVYNAANVSGNSNVGGLLGLTVKDATSIQNSYFSGKVTATLTSGNIVGISTSNTTYWDTGNVISNVYYLADKTVVGTDNYSTALSYAEMGALELDGWINGDDYTYPVLEETDNTLVYAAAVIPTGEDESYDEITGTLFLGMPEGVTWTASVATVEIGDNTATFTESYTGPLTLTATAGDVSVSTELECNVDVIIPITLAATGDTVEEGDDATLTVEISTGTAPFSITWTNGKHETIGSATLEATGSSTTTYTPSECDLYYVNVVDGVGLEASDTCRVIVTGNAVTATFENLYLDEASYWAGPDTKGETADYYGATQWNGSFLSGSYSFSNSYVPDWASWTGFAYSNSTDNDFVSYYYDQYNSAPGGGYDNSENFAVAYSGGTINVLNNTEGDTVDGFYITNNTYLTNSVVNGDSYARAFVSGDYIRVVFTGTQSDGSSSQVTYYLADYTSENEADWYYLDTWQWVDLRPLGDVTSISFDFEGTDESYGYLNTPTYFCLDNFNGERVVETAETQRAGGDILLSTFFSFESDEATVSYAFADDPADDIADMVSLSSDGILSVSDDADGSFSVVVSATQRGKIQFLEIPFDFTDGITSVSAGTGDSDETARYTVDGRLISSPTRGINIVRSADGRTRKIMVK